MAESPGAQRSVEEMISSYEERLHGISAIIDNTQMVLGEFQESMPDAKQERESLKAELRDTLAKNESLRKKDFDAMMNTILLAQDRRETKVRGLLNSYFTEQRDMAATLRENLGDFRGSLNKDNIDRVKEFHQMLQGILNKQKERKAEVTTALTNYQEEQSKLSRTLVELLSRGRDLRTKDLRLMLRQFGAQSGERATEHQERKEDVQLMLNSFRKERIERAHA